MLGKHSGLFQGFKVLSIYQTYTIISGFWTPILYTSIFCAILMCFSLQNAKSETAPIVITMLGDSLTAGYGLPIGEGLTDQLQTALNEKTDKKINIRIINAGVSGDTTAGGLARFDWSIPSETDALIIALGGNDALRGVPPESSSKNIEAMIIKAHQTGISVLLAGMAAPRNMGEDYVQKFDAIYPYLAGKYDVVFMPFLLEGVAADPALNQPDLIHPNQEGVAIMVSKLLPHIDRLTHLLGKSDNSIAP
ncbi:MAG: arylesterase [Candidatus Micropelagos sp.]